MSVALPLEPIVESPKRTLEALLRARRLLKESPPLRGEDRRFCPLATGIDAVDRLLTGGFPRGQLSELYGPGSCGRTSVFLALAARVTRAGGLIAFVDPLDRLDPASAEGASVDLSRFLWLRGPGGADEDAKPMALAAATAAAATLVGSGLFDLVALDLAGASRALRTLPAATWLRLQRLVEETPTGLVLLGDAHVACGLAGAALVVEPRETRWSGPPGPARLLRGLVAGVRAVGRGTAGFTGTVRPGTQVAEIVLSAAAA